MNMIFPFPVYFQVLFTSPFIFETQFLYYSSRADISWNDICLNPMQPIFHKCQFYNSLYSFCHIPLIDFFRIEFIP